MSGLLSLGNIERQSMPERHEVLGVPVRGGSDKPPTQVRLTATALFILLIVVCGFALLTVDCRRAKANAASMRRDRAVLSVLELGGVIQNAISTVPVRLWTTASQH